MDNCLNCNKELTHISGKRKKKFCGKKCKADFLKNNNPYRALTEAGKLVLDYCKEKGISIQELIEDHTKFFFNKTLLVGGNYTPKIESKTDSRLPALTAGMKQVVISEGGRRAGKTQKTQIWIESQIKAINAEKIPKERDTQLGRQTWKIEQKKRIDELKNQLK